MIFLTSEEKLTKMFLVCCEETKLIDLEKLYCEKICITGMEESV